ncbi:MAG TPA: hypothetical protein VF201_13765 [Nitrolancea sp.]
MSSHGIGTNPVRGPITLATYLRSQVFSYWRGPEVVTVPGANDDQFYGWQMLALDVRIDHRGSRPELEARVVYANTSDDTQPRAILRAVYWDNDAERAALAREGLQYRFGFPARFVWLPVDTLNRWLDQLDGIDTTVTVHARNDPFAPIRRLCTKTDYKACVFERAWQLQECAKTPLDQAWDKVWRQMSDVLSVNPRVVDRVVEEFSPEYPQPFYNLDAYHPNHWDGENPASR